MARLPGMLMLRAHYAPELANGMTRSAVAARLPRHAIVFLDEAYVEFAGASFLNELASCPNVLLGRTFAKAYGLAAVRAGYLVQGNRPIPARPFGPSPGEARVLGRTAAHAAQLSYRHPLRPVQARAAPGCGHR